MSQLEHQLIDAYFTEPPSPPPPKPPQPPLLCLTDVDDGVGAHCVASQYPQGMKQQCQQLHLHSEPKRRIHESTSLIIRRRGREGRWGGGLGAPVMRGGKKASVRKNRQRRRAALKNHHRLVRRRQIPECKVLVRVWGRQETERQAGGGSGERQTGVSEEGRGDG